MRGETAYTADVTSRMAASQNLVLPRDICTPSHDFLELRALIDNRATGRAGESLRNFGPDLESSICRASSKASSRNAVPLSIAFPFIIDRYVLSSRSIEIINLISGRNFIGIDPSSVFGFIEFVRVSKYARVSSFSALRVSSARVSSRKNGYSTSFFERPFPLPSLLLEN